MFKRKGIVLAGGDGTRLSPLTKATSKQLLHVYDKPLIYYPISMLLEAKINEIAIITKPMFTGLFKSLLGDGSQWGLEFTYIEQPRAEGLAQAYILAENFLDGSPSALVLGDNIFHGSDLNNLISIANNQKTHATIFSYQVSEPERYGVLEIDKNGRLKRIVEKPTKPKSNLAITGLYFFDGSAPDRAKRLHKSKRGEYEITDLIQTYFVEGKLKVISMNQGSAWFDAGTFKSLLDAANFVASMQVRQGLLVGSPEKAAFKNGQISADAFRDFLEIASPNEYTAMLKKLID